jgi:hypothetical protein
MNAVFAPSFHPVCTLAPQKCTIKSRVLAGFAPFAPLQSVYTYPFLLILILNTNLYPVQGSLALVFGPCPHFSSKLVKAGQSWSKLVKAGQSWSKLVKAQEDSI